MKVGFKHMTSTFGRDAERYVARLFGMDQNKNGTLLPDLVSPYDYEGVSLSLEVKSGQGMKGVMVDHQMQYSRGSEHHAKEFGNTDPRQKLLFALPEERKIAHYYDLIDRVDGLSSEEVDIPFSGVLMQWGNQFIVPHEFGYYSFAVSRAIRTNSSVEQALAHLRQLVKHDCAEESSHHKRRITDKNSWQNLYGRDILAVFLGDMSIATEKGRERIELLRKHYDEMAQLIPIAIEGPNQTQIYVLARPSDKDLFEKQVVGVVRERKDELQRVSIQRLQAQRLLDKVYMSQVGLHERGVTSEDVAKLESLCAWKEHGH